MKHITKALNKALAIGGATAALAGLGLVTGASSASATTPTTYNSSSLINHYTDLCLDASGGATAGAAVIQWYCNGGGNQYWTRGEDSYGRPRLELAYYGLCLDNPGGSTSPNTGLIVWYCNDGDNQVWTSPSVGGTWDHVINPATGFALDDPGWSTTAGQQMKTWYYNEGDNQYWGFEPHTQI